MKYALILSFGLLAIACTQTVKKSVSIEMENNADSFEDTSVYNVAFLIMDGTFNTELTAPMDIFSSHKIS